MRSRPRFLWFALVVLIGAYGAAYRFFPKRDSYIGVYLEHHRRFAHRWELFFYYPAAFAEALLIRAWPGLYGARIQCPQSIVLDAQEQQRIVIRATPFPPPIDAVIPAQVDILDHVLEIAHGRHGRTRSGHDSSFKDCKYPNCALDRAEDFLNGRQPRPWTIGKVLRWYREATDPTTRLHWGVILGASRDPRAELALGETLESDRPAIDEAHLRIMAGLAIDEYFVPQPDCGDWPIAGVSWNPERAMVWFKADKARLKKVCAGL